MAATVERRRAHVLLPREIIDEIDATVGPRGRSRFILEAVEERLQRQRRLAAFERVVGSVADGEIPEWETPESTAAWLEELRRGCDAGSEPSPR